MSDFTEKCDTSTLGARLKDGGCSFGLWAPRAEKVILTLVDEIQNQTNHEMSKDERGIWNIFIPGVKAEQRYGFRLYGPWDPSSGARFNPQKILLDPYAKAITGGVDYAGPIRDHTSDSNYEPDINDSLNSVPLSVVIAHSEPPTALKSRRPLTECVIYETHLKGFTQLHPQVPEHLRGTYRGLSYRAVIDYLVSTGINTIELLPLHHFVSEPFIIGRGLSNYWGYNTLGYFAPHAFYGSVGTLGEQVLEFKKMVSALHEAGIEVILDVVYNHTAEGGHEGPTLCFRGIDHGAYYRLTNDLRNDYDVTGCGNSVDTSNPWVLELILDSLRYWVTEMGVDGFRFDLATTLIRDELHQVNQDHPFKKRIAADPTFSDIKFIAEPWDMGPYGYQVGNWGPGWSEWNDRSRNFFRDYWRCATTGVQELATRLCGSPDLYDRPGRNLSAGINFITAHDGFTMRDLVTYDVKHNDANGESNRDGSDDNRSSNYGWEGDTDDPKTTALRHRQVKNMLATLLLSSGVPMIAAGDEIGRTQLGNNNAYCQDSPLSWIHWDAKDEWSDVHELTKTLLKLRADNPVLRPTDFLQHSEITDANGNGLGRVDLAWMDGFEGEMGEDDWHDGSRRMIGMYLSNTDKAFLTWFNAAQNDIEIFLPGLPWGRRYRALAYTCDNNEVSTDWLEASTKMTLPQRSVICMEVEVSASAEELKIDLKRQEVKDLAIAASTAAEVARLAKEDSVKAAENAKEKQRLADDALDRANKAKAELPENNLSAQSDSS